MLEKSWTNFIGKDKTKYKFCFLFPYNLLLLPFTIKILHLSSHPYMPFISPLSFVYNPSFGMSLLLAHEFPLPLFSSPPLFLPFDFHWFGCCGWRRSRRILYCRAQETEFEHAQFVAPSTQLPLITLSSAVYIQNVECTVATCLCGTL